MTIEGHVENGQIILNPKIALPEGAKVRVEVVQDQGSAIPPAPEEKTHYDHYKSVIGAIDDLPADFALEHDHYLYGSPKK